METFDHMNEEQESDFDYQGKRPDQVDYSEKAVCYILIAFGLMAIIALWELISVF